MKYLLFLFLLSLTTPAFAETKVTGAEVSTTTAMTVGSLVISTYSATSNGFTYLPGGILLEWGGTGTITTGSSQYVTLPKPCPSQLLNVTATMNSTTSSNSYSWSVGGGTVNGFTLYSNGAIAAAYSWIAICK